MRWVFPANYMLLATLGERLRVKARVLFTDHSPHSIPQCFQLVIKAPSYAQVASPGGEWSPSSLLVSVAVDGSFAFDLLIPKDAVTGFVNAPLTFTNARTGQLVWKAPVTAIWPQMPITPELRTVDRFVRGSLSVPVGCDDLLVEVARDEVGADWHPNYLFFGYGRKPQETYVYEYCVEQTVTDPAYPHNGPLKVRVIPILYHKPIAPRPRAYCFLRPPMNDEFEAAVREVSLAESP